jgi:hypothetical protein
MAEDENKDIESALEAAKTSEANSPPPTPNPAQRQLMDNADAMKDQDDPSMGTDDLQPGEQEQP